MPNPPVGTARSAGSCRRIPGSPTAKPPELRGGPTITVERVGEPQNGQPGRVGFRLVRPVHGPTSERHMPFGPCAARTTRRRLPRPDDQRRLRSPPAIDPRGPNGPLPITGPCGGLTMKRPLVIVARLFRRRGIRESHTHSSWSHARHAAGDCRRPAGARIRLRRRG